MMGRIFGAAPENTRDRISLIRTRLAEIPPIFIHGGDYEQTRRAHTDATVAMIADLSLLDPEASFQQRSDQSIVRMLGLRATSTAGLPAALRNWCVQAEAKLPPDPETIDF